MKRYFLPATLFLFFYSVSAQKWDSQMQLTRCSIKVDADIFTATTFIEMEFFNNTKTEIEGLYTFQLQPHQVITAFQLDLHGKFRDGSIEEKWKATNAYNTIVGKRIDPALLTMESVGQYSLRIYPVPARGSRRITMTIQQPMEMKETYVHYSLPMNIRERVANFTLNINVNGNERPFAKNGLIHGANFVNHTSSFNYALHAEKVMLDKTLEFSIPVHLQQPQVCTKSSGGKNHFAIRFLPGVSKTYNIKPTKLTIFWDVSSSHDNRDIPKELNFIEQYLNNHDIKHLSIITFNFRTKDTMIFRDVRRNKLWKQFLSQQEYDGATQLGAIDLTQLNTDVAFIFSDGWNTYGKNRPNPGNVLVYTISTGRYVNQALLSDIVKKTGGDYIDLEKTNIESAIGRASQAQNLLLHIRSAKGKTILDEMPGQDTDKPLLLSGTTDAVADTLFIFYGNNTVTPFIQKIPIRSNVSCKGMIDRMAMLTRFRKIHGTHDWNNVLDFGLEEKVVTLNTAYIVLERVEDYIKYNITPPLELEAECDQLNYVKKDTRQQRLSLKQQQDISRFTYMVSSYNERIRNWDARAPLMQVTADEFKLSGSNWYKYEEMQSGDFVATNASGSIFPDAAITEKVVSNGFMSTKIEAFYSTSQIRKDQLGSATSVSEALTGRIQGLNVTVPGNETQVMLRGYSSMPVQRQPLLVIDGIPTDRPLNDLNTNDIDHITVIKGASATAIYGGRGANGVIVLTSKRGKKGGAAYDRWLRTKLQNQEDVDYLQEIRQVRNQLKYDKYLELKKLYNHNAGFYFDMAQHLHESGYTDEALSVLSNAAELNPGVASTQKAIAYVLESWKYYNDAVVIYKSLIEAEPMNHDYISDLSWVYYQQGNIQEAVNVLFERIIADDLPYYSYYSNGLNKALLLEQMNAIINIHRDALDVSLIPPALIRPLPVDLKIIVQNNTSQIGYLEVTEPTGNKTREYHSINNPRFKGHYRGNYNPGIREYTIKEAKEGKYSVAIWHHDQGTGKTIPSFIRMIAIKNYGRKDQEITMQHFCMDNQEGLVEIGGVIMK